MGCSGSTTKSNNFNFCISIDGSEHSEMGFNKILNDTFKKGNKLYLVHITNSKKLNEMPFENLPEQLLPKYEHFLSEKLHKNEYEILKKDKIQTQTTVLESVVQIATVKKVDLIVVGSVGHKGQKQTKSLTKGLDFLINNCKIPTLVMKKYTPRLNKQSKGFNWLVCIKDENERSFKSFEFCCKIINRENDTIIGLNFSKDNNLSNKVNNIFQRMTKEHRIKNKIFISKELDDNLSLGKNILNYLMFGQEYVEYVVVNHNITKYKNVELCPTVDLIRYCNNNVIFCRE